MHSKTDTKSFKNTDIVIKEQKKGKYMHSGVTITNTD